MEVQAVRATRNQAVSDLPDRFPAGAGEEPNSGESESEQVPEPEPTGTPRGSRVASPIVVGVSPVTGSRAARQWAVKEAEVRRARVRAVMAWLGAPRRRARPVDHGG